MNKKEQAIWVIIDNVIKCCVITNPDGTPSITREDIFEKEPELIFNRWYADMAKQGIPIEWDDMI